MGVPYGVLTEDDFFVLFEDADVVGLQIELFSAAASLVGSGVFVADGLSIAFGNILLNGVGDISAAGVLFGRDRSRFQVSPYFISVVSDLPDSGSVPWVSASSSTVVNPGPSWDVEVL